MIAPGAAAAWRTGLLAECTSASDHTDFPVRVLKKYVFPVLRDTCFCHPGGSSSPAGALVAIFAGETETETESVDVTPTAELLAAMQAPPAKQQPLPQVKCGRDSARSPPFGSNMLRIHEDDERSETRFGVPEACPHTSLPYDGRAQQMCSLATWPA